MKAPISEKGEIDLPTLIAKLKNMGYPLESAFTYYYSNELEINIYCGHDPLPKNCMIPKEEFSDGKPIRLKFRPGLRSEYCDNTKDHQKTKIQKRTKERKIGFIIEKVSLWRQLYNGVPDSTGKVVRYSLEDAAQVVGISKKSLDDYLSQLRKGRKYGYDFN